MKKVLTIVTMFALVGVVYGANPKGDPEQIKEWNAYGKIAGGSVLTLSKSTTVPVTLYTLLPESPAAGEALAKSIVNTSDLKTVQGRQTNLKENATLVADFKKATDKKVFYTKGRVTLIYKEGNFVYAEISASIFSLSRKITIAAFANVAIPVASLNSLANTVNVEFSINDLLWVTGGDESFYRCSMTVLRLQPTGDLPEGNLEANKITKPKHYFRNGYNEQEAPVPTWDETKAIILTSDNVLSRDDVKAMKPNRETFDFYPLGVFKPANGSRFIITMNQNDFFGASNFGQKTDNVLKDVAKQSVYWLVECIVVDGKLEPLRGCPIKDWPTPKDWKPYTPYVPKAASQPASQAVSQPAAK